MPSSATNDASEQLELFAPPTRATRTYHRHACPRCGFVPPTKRAALTTGSALMKMRNWSSTRTLLLDHRPLLAQLPTLDYALLIDRFLLDTPPDDLPSTKIPPLRALGANAGLTGARVHQRLSRALGRLQELVDARSNPPTPKVGHP